MASYLESIGMVPLSDDEAFDGLQNIMRTDSTSLLYAAVDWAKVGRANARFGSAPRTSPVMISRSAGSTHIRAELATALPEQRLELLQTFLCAEIGKVLKVDADTVPTDRPMTELGLDSLSSFELKSRIENELSLTLTVAKFLQAPTIVELTQVVDEIFEEVISADAGAANAGATDATIEAQQARRSAARDIVVSDRQRGLIAMTLAKMTTPRARAALEHQLRLHVGSSVTVKKLQQAVNRLARRHEVVRLTLDPEATGGEAVLALGPTPKVEHFDTWCDAVGRPLAVEDGELLRVCHVDDASGGWILSMRAHAAVADAWSVGFLAEELLRICRGDVLEKPAGRKVLRHQLAMRRFDEEDVCAIANRSFWHEAMTPWPQPVPFSRRGRALAPVGLGCNRGVIDEVSTKINPTLFSALADTRIEALIMSAYADALANLTGVLELVICRFGSGREATGMERIAGPFCDELPVPFRKLGQASLAGLAGGAERHLAVASQHRNFDLFSCETLFRDLLLECSAAPRQIGFSYMRDSGGQMPLQSGPGGSQIATVAEHDIPDLYDVLLIIEQHASGAKLRLRFDVDVLDSEAAARLMHLVLDGLSRLVDIGGGIVKHATSASKVLVGQPVSDANSQSHGGKSTELGLAGE
jgi:acyl carrier protein